MSSTPSGAPAPLLFVQLTDAEGEALQRQSEDSRRFISMHLDRLEGENGLEQAERLRRQHDTNLRLRDALAEWQERVRHSVTPEAREQLPAVERYQLFASALQTPHPVRGTIQDDLVRGLETVELARHLPPTAGIAAMLLRLALHGDEPSLLETLTRHPDLASTSAELLPLFAVTVNEPDLYTLAATASGVFPTGLPILPWRAFGADVIEVFNRAMNPRRETSPAEPSPADAQQGKGENRPGGQPEADSSPPLEALTTERGDRDTVGWVTRCGGALCCAPDCAEVCRGAETFTFRGNEQAVISHMIDGWESGRRTWNNEDLLHVAESAGERLRDVFKKVNPAWNTPIVEAENKGQYTLRMA